LIGFWWHWGLNAGPHACQKSELITQHSSCSLWTKK
jgi:hypothetical protein